MLDSNNDRSVLAKSQMLFCHQGKLELFTGAQAGTMTIKVFNKDDELVCVLDNDNALLGSYPIDDGMRFHVSFINEYFI